MAGDFLDAGPLDLQSLMGAIPSPLGGPQGVSQPQPQQKPGFDKSKLLRLIPLVAAAAKGGPGAMEGLLSGYQQAAAQKQQQATQQAGLDRQSMLDQRTLANDQFSQNMRLAEFNQQQETQRAGLVKEFSNALLNEELTDPEAVRALTQLYEARGRALGVRPGTFETTAMQVVKPSTLETKAAKKKIAELRTQFSTKWMEEGAKFTHELPGGKRVSFQELIGLAGMTADPAAKPPAAEVPNTDYGRFLDRYARERGKTFETLTVAEEAAAKKLYGQADDRPPVSLTIGASGMTPAQTATFNGIVANYQRSPLIRAADRTLVLDQAIKQIEKNPSDPSAQLNLAYSYIQALDTYQSAVREGELQNLGVLGTRLEQFKKEMERVATTGAFLPPTVATNIAQNAKTLVSTIKAGKAAKQQEYASQARVVGVGAAWDEYVRGSGGAGIAKPATGNPYGGK